MNTAKGGKKAAETNRERYGDDFYARIGKKGGVVRNPKKGFGSNPELAASAGSKGGKKSRRA